MYMYLKLCKYVRLLIIYYSYFLNSVDKNSLKIGFVGPQSADQKKKQKTKIKKET